MILLVPRCRCVLYFVINVNNVFKFILFPKSLRVYYFRVYSV